jgi:hypothetical protein
VPYEKKIVLNCLSGNRAELDTLVADFMRDGVRFVGVVGRDCSVVEEEIDELCVGDGSRPYEMLTSSHVNESLADALAFAQALGLEFSGEVQVVEL